MKKEIEAGNKDGRKAFRVSGFITAIEEKQAGDHQHISFNIISVWGGTDTMVLILCIRHRSRNST